MYTDRIQFIIDGFYSGDRPIKGRYLKFLLGWGIIIIGLVAGVFPALGKLFYVFVRDIRKLSKLRTALNGEKQGITQFAGAVTMKRKILWVVGLFFSMGVFSDSPVFKWEQTDVSVALKNGSKTVWRFYYGKDKDKPFFHPLALLDGTELTEESHQNHPWHHGLWFSWKYINEVNFWEENIKTGKAKGKNSWSNVKIETHSDYSAEIAIDLSYTLPDEKEPVLREKRRMLVSAPDDNGTYCIDWESIFMASSGRDVRLDRTPLPNEPGGKRFGGYAGLSVRFKETATDIQVHTEKGRATEWQHGRLRGEAWTMDYSGLIDGKAAGIAIMESPANLNAPTMWYAINSRMKFFSPAVLCKRPYTLGAGDSITLRYRICVHEDRWTTAMLKDLLRSLYDGRL